MAHIHELIDFTIVVYIVHNNRVLLVDHKQLKAWMPIGGHIELDEDPEQALYREIKEESGLENVELLGGKKPTIVDQGTKPLLAPIYMDIHDITNTHRHTSLVYFGQVKKDNVKLAEREHNDIRWFTREELDSPQYNLKPFIKFYSVQALTKIKQSELL